MEVSIRGCLLSEPEFIVPLKTKAYKQSQAKYQNGLKQTENYPYNSSSR